MKSIVNFNPKINKISSVTEYNNGYSIELDNYCGFGIDKKCGVKPKVGDTVQMRGGIGEIIKGVKINDKIVFNKTEAELDQEHKVWVDKKDREVSIAN